MKSQIPEGHLEAWRKSYVGFWRALTAIEADLEAAGLPSLSCYDALYELYLAPGRHLRMSELARHALLSRSALTRLVDKLEKDKLIVRQSCAADGRVHHAQLTDKGVEMLRTIWRTYRLGIAKYFAAHLSESDARELTRIFGKVINGLEPACTRLKAEAR